MLSPPPLVWSSFYIHILSDSVHHKHLAGTKYWRNQVSAAVVKIVSRLSAVHQETSILSCSFTDKIG